MAKIFTALPQERNSRQRIYFNNLHLFFQKHRSVFFSFLFAFIAVLSFLIVKNLSITKATVSGFDAGNIMSDYVMSNSSTMSEADIQNFLKSKNPCNDTRIYLANYYPHLHYNIRDGHFVCMADDIFHGETAAHIIWQAAQDYRINPQVILTLLEKEQGLITDTWPNHKQYNSATGFGCPDTAACDAQYFGLKNQVRHAATLFREVLDGGWTNYPLGNTYVQYNPDPACGGSTINIRSRATSALYRYTPYQPNAGALANHPGTAPCGAYGNRNFYSFFTDWFGNPTIGKPALPYENLNLIDIDNSEYRIASTIDRYHFLDVAGASLDEGAKVQLYEKWSESNKAQIWTFEPAGEKQYFIKSSLTQKYMTVNEIKNGSEIIQKSKINSCTQKWFISKRDDNIVIHNACNKSFALDVNAAKSFNQARTQIYERWSLSNPAQEWQLEKVLLPNNTQLIQDGNYRISTILDKTKYIDIYGANTVDFTKVQLYEKWSEANKAQIWDIKHQGENIYTITSTLSKKLLTIYQTKSGAQAVTFSNKLVGCGQLWRAINTANGIRFFSFCNNNYALDVRSGLNKNGTPIQIFKEWTADNKAQDWRLEPVSSQLIQDGTYRISTALNSKQFLDVWGASTANFAKVQLYEKWSEANKAQIWDIKHQGNDEYVIKSALSGKILTANLVGNNQQAFLTDNIASQPCYQVWKALSNGGSIIFLNSCNKEYALDVYGAIAINQAKVQLYKRWTNKNLAQEWILYPL